ncbi:MAG: ROK family protein [Candidatus Dormibacteria bacterium]
MQPDRILLAPNLPGWEEIDLAARLRSATGITVGAVTNDVRAGALADARLGALRGCRCGLYVNLGTAIAAALVMDDRVAEGAHHAAARSPRSDRPARSGPGSRACTPLSSPSWVAGRSPNGRRTSWAGP